MRPREGAQAKKFCCTLARKILLSKSIKKRFGGIFSFGFLSFVNVFCLSRNQFPESAKVVLVAWKTP